MGEIRNILPRRIDRKEDSGELTKGVYTTQLSGVIGEGAFDKSGNTNIKFLEATTVVPYPRECHEAWDMVRNEAIANYNMASEINRDEWERRLGPLFQVTLANVKNRAVMPRGMRIQSQGTNTYTPGRPPPAQMEIIQDEAVTNDGRQCRGN